MARTAGLNVVVTGDTKGLDRALGNAHKGLDKFGKQTSVTARVTSKGFTGIGLAARGMAAGVGAGALGVGFLVKQFEESNKVAKQTDAVLKSTGGAANVTARQVSDLATAISRKTGIDDEAIQSGENLLLTFTNVRNEAGKGNKIFDESTRLLADMSTALGQDTKSSAIQLGKALNDPIKGVTALQRVGVSFTASQKEQIATLVESGKTLDAQKLILGELNKEFGGSAAAQGTAFDKLKVSAGNLAETAGKYLAPALSAAAGWLTHILEDLQDGNGPIAGFLSSIGDLGGKVIDQFNRIKDDPKGPGAAIGAMIVGGIDKIDWRALGGKVSAGFNSALKIGGKVGAAIVDAFKQVPWGTVGDTIGDGVSGAMLAGNKLPGQISAGLSQAVSKVNGRQVLGKLVDIVGEAIEALLSPSFWIEHFKAIFTGVTLVIPIARILKIPGAAFLFRFISKPIFSAVQAMGRGLLSLLGKAAGEGGVRFLAELEKVAPKTANFLLWLVTRAGRALSGLPRKLAGIATDAAESVAKRLGDGVGGIVGAIARWVIRGVGRLRSALPTFAKAAISVGAATATGILTGLGQLGHSILKKVKDSLSFVADALNNPGGIPGAVGKAIGKGITGALGSGDGLGKQIIGGMSIPGLGGPGGKGALMGADPDLQPFANIAAGFGLSTTSGLRPGAITSSGNPSYHGSGDAIDESGPPGAMMRFFQFMKSSFGGRLRELIYTPGGVGIKDGRPFRYTGKVAADHFDHVHVAYTGPFGDGPGRRQGDGLGKFVSTSYGPPWGGIQGTGVTATGVNLKGGPHRYGIAVDPRVIPLGSKVKVTPNPFGYGGLFTAFDTGGAIKGKRIDFYDWRGRKAQNGWGRRTVTVATADHRSSSRGGGSGGTGPTSLGQGGSVVGSGNTAAGVGSTTAGGPNEPLLGPGQGGSTQQLADIDVRKGTAESRDDLPGLIDALKDELRIKRRRIRKIRRMLKHRLRKATRLRLTQELSTLIGEVGDLAGTLKEYRADERGGAKTISEAETLDAGVDPNADSPSGSGGDPNQPLIDAINAAAELQQRLADERKAADQEIAANQQLLLKLASQGPELVAAVVAAVNGGLGGKVGLGFATPSYPGGVASY